jgi:hypothetical protein
MALPTALFALIASFALATAAILSSVDVQEGSHYDSSRKDAIAAADAGASVALLRLNRFEERLTDTNNPTPCVGPAGESLPETSVGSGWCPATKPESLSGGGATFTYQVSAYSEGSPALSVVAIGTAGTVSRRIEVGLITFGGKQVFADEHLIGQEKIEVIGNPYIKTDIGTNGDVIGKGNAFELCGNVRHGIGKVAPEPDCNGEVLEGNKELPEVNPPENIATHNSNCRLVPNCVEDPLEVDPYVTQGGGSGKGKGGGPASPWNPTTRELEIGNNSTLTMGGSDYFICKLVINGGGELIMAGQTQVRIFVDTPENCGYSSGVIQVEIKGGAEIKSTANNQGEAAIPSIYVLGSTETETRVVLAGTPSGNDDGTHELLLYAPNSNIEIKGNATWKGAIAGKSLIINGNPTIESLPGAEDTNLTTSKLWERTRYVECTGPTGLPPNADC